MEIWDSLHSSFKSLNIIDYESKQLMRKVNYVFFGFLFGAIVEHFQFLSRGLGQMFHCPDIENSFEFFCRFSYQAFFHVHKYNVFLGIFVMITNGVAAVVWSITDNFLMVIGILLTHEFQLLNRKISLNIQNVSLSFWENHFLAYQKLCNLVKEINVVFGAAILASFAANLFFVCLQCMLQYK